MGVALEGSRHIVKINRRSENRPVKPESLQASLVTENDYLKEELCQVRAAFAIWTEVVIATCLNRTNRKSSCPADSKK